MAAWVALWAQQRQHPVPMSPSGQRRVGARGGGTGWREGGREGERETDITQYNPTHTSAGFCNRDMSRRKVNRTGAPPCWMGVGLFPVPLVLLVAGVELFRCTFTSPPLAGPAFKLGGLGLPLGKQGRGGGAQLLELQSVPGGELEGDIARGP